MDTTFVVHATNPPCIPLRECGKQSLQPLILDSGGLNGRLASLMIPPA